MKSLGGVKVLCEDKDGNRCQIRLQELINYILANQYTMAKTVSSKRWMCKPELYFDYQVVADASPIAFQKLTSHPAIVTYIRYKDGDKIRGRIIFISDNRNGVVFTDLNDEIYSSDIRMTDYKGEVWYYQLTPDCKLMPCQEVSMASNLVYNNLDNAIRDIFSFASIKDATLWTGVPDSEDYVFVVGALDKDRPETGLVTIDIYGNIETREV